MQPFDFAQTALGTSPLIVSGLLGLATGVFCLSVLSYLLVSGTFQSRRRRGWWSGDGMAFVVAGVLFLAFSASYLEIFAIAFRLPFSAYQDLLIGLGAVGLAMGLAKTTSTWLEKRRIADAVGSLNGR